jgi:hypothetical protein
MKGKERERDFQKLFQMDDDDQGPDQATNSNFVEFTATDQDDQVTLTSPSTAKETSGSRHMFSPWTSNIPSSSPPSNSQSIWLRLIAIKDISYVLTSSELASSALPDSPSAASPTFPQQPSSSSSSDGYKKQLSALDLTLIGIGGIIGAGIFVITGRAAKDYAGPALVISFLIAGFVSTLASLCYAELASLVPISYVSFFLHFTHVMNSVLEGRLILTHMQHWGNS